MGPVAEDAKHTGNDRGRKLSQETKNGKEPQTPGSSNHKRLVRNLKFETRQVVPTCLEKKEVEEEAS